MRGRTPAAASAVSVRQRIRPALLCGPILKRLVRRALLSLRAEGADVRVLVVGDAEMTRWNRTVFGKDRTTNVISFPEEEPAEEGAGILRGDILVCAPACLRQTRGWEGTPEERIFFFVLHAVLHLAGFEHVGNAGAARRMRRKELALYRAVTGADPR